MTTEIQEIYRSDWSESLAAGAYFMLKQVNPEVIDFHEPVWDPVVAVTFAAKLKQANNHPRIWEGFNFLQSEVAFSYTLERATSFSNPGGPLTLSGHASREIIRLGFVALLCSSLDDFHAFETFMEYSSLDKKVMKAINTSQPGSAVEDVEARRLKWIELQEACEVLCEEAGI
jgi:hypothetical protein